MDIQLSPKWISVFEKIALFPIDLSWLPCQNPINHKCENLICTLISILLIYVFSLLVPQYLDYSETTEYFLNLQSLSPWFFFFFFFFNFKAAPVAHGSSQARGQIGAAPGSLSTATAMRDPSHVCNLYHSSQQCQVLNTLSEDRDRTGILMHTSWVPYHWTTSGTPSPLFHLSFSRSFRLFLCLSNFHINFRIDLSVSTRK